jgi:hypothetical protein
VAACGFTGFILAKCKMNSVFSRIAKTARELLSQTSLYWIFALAIPFFIVKSSKFLRHPKSNIPRIGLAPGELPGENGSFVECGVKYVQDGYKKVRFSFAQFSPLFLRICGFLD